MKKEIKKIIAKEFLFIVGTLILYVLTYFIWSYLNDSNLETEIIIENEIENLESTLPRGQEFNQNGIPIIEKVYLYNGYEYKESVLLKKYGSDLEANIKEHGFVLKKTITAKQAKDFILKKLELYEKLNKIQNSIFRQKNYKKEESIGLIIVTVFFILRYLVYGIKWSIKQLKD